MILKFPLKRKKKHWPPPPPPYPYLPLSEISILLTSWKNTIFGGRLRRGWITIVKSICTSYLLRKWYCLVTLVIPRVSRASFDALAFGAVLYPDAVMEEHLFGLPPPAEVNYHSKSNTVLRVYTLLRWRRLYSDEPKNILMYVCLCVTRQDGTALLRFIHAS